MRKKTFKKCVAGLLGVLCAISLIACAKSDNKDEKTTAETKETVIENDTKKSIDISDAKLVSAGKLTVGMVIDYPPFEYFPTNNDKPIGIDVDIINAVAKQLGLEVEIKNVDWDDALFTSMGSKYDVVCSAVTITEDRAKNMLFSNSYIDSYQSVVVRKDSALSIKGFDSLEGLNVAVQSDTVSDNLIQSLIKDKKMNIKVKENSVATDCFKQLQTGEVDAIVCDSTVTEGQVARNPEMFVEAYRDESKVEKFAIAIGKDNKGLQTAINEALDNLHSEDDTVKKIIKSWFSR